MSLSKAIAEHDGTKVAVACGDACCTYAELVQQSERLAGNLLAAGAEPGDRVAVHLQNGLEAALAYVGCLRAGCVAVPLNTRLKGREIDYILRHSGSAFYIGEPALYGPIADGCPALAQVERYLTGDEQVGGARAFGELLGTHAVQLPEVDVERLTAILYTSGTTAHPKGVMHSHGTLLQTARVMREMGLDEGQTVLVMSSMAHMVGFVMLFLAGLVNGATVVLTRPTAFADALEAYARWRCTFTLTLPVLLRGLLAEQVRAPRDLASGQYFYAGGDSVSPALQKAFLERIAPVCEVYGATEVAPVLWNRAGEACVGAMGKPGARVTVRLTDADGTETKPGEAGELWVKAAHRMLGYWQDQEATSAALAGEWYRTGDIARCDADGNYWFAGRRKEIVVRGGSNISPQEVEAALYEHPAVSEAGVVGHPDALWGELVIAHVALRPGAQVGEAELVEFVRGRLADYKVPERIVFHTELPRSASGKIQRRALRERAAAARPA